MTDDTEAIKGTWLVFLSIMSLLQTLLPHIYLNSTAEHLSNVSAENDFEKKFRVFPLPSKIFSQHRNT